METKQKKVSETSTREQALAWWNKLVQQQKEQLYLSYYGCKVTDKFPDEIEEIWRKETQQIQDSIDVDSWSNDGSDPKPNQKQFKQFDKELFKKYIDKFNDEDKIQALFILTYDLKDRGVFNI